MKKNQEPAFDPGLARQLHRDMVLYRRFEERMNVAYTKQKFSGFLHLHIGQEAIAAGSGRAMLPQDYAISGYRSHTQAIAKGLAPSAVMAELFGKATGCSKGKGGSMHMFSREHGFLGGHGIVGGQAPIAVGAAFALKAQQSDGNVVCFLGDAAMNQGQVFEAMNMAATWALPVVFFVENNRYGMGTDIQRTTSVDHLYKRALAFDMAWQQIDGMDVLEVYRTTQQVLEVMRGDRQPVLIEALTYRYKGHSVSDPAHYRNKEEVDAYRQRDPIARLEQALIENAGARPEEFAALDQDIKEQLRAWEADADAAPPPAASELYTDVYA